jgi:hypothetical protein
MVVQHHHDNLRWMAPHPLWLAGAPGLNGAAGRPAILRFDNDSFMEEITALTAARPEALPAWLAVPETWREPAPPPPREGLTPNRPLSQARAEATGHARRRGLIGGAAAKPVSQAPAGSELKLYQPAQDRFYLVAAQLVCARPGLPDHRIEARKQEKAGFVMRRLVPPAGSTGPVNPDDPAVTEYAFVPRAAGGYWRRLNAGERGQLFADEERLGLFPLGYDADGRKRRLLLGAVPVARREVYAGAPLGPAGGAAPPTSDPLLPSARKLLWINNLTAPWTALQEQADTVARFHPAAPPPGMTPTQAADRAAIAGSALRDFRATAAMIGWFLLADTRAYLKAHLPELWADLAGQPTTRPLTAAEVLLKGALQAISAPADLISDYETAFPAYSGDVEGNFVSALVRMTDAQAAMIETADTAFSWPPVGSLVPTPFWPDFVWIAAHPSLKVTAAAVSAQASWQLPASGQITALETLIEAALPTQPTAPVPDLAAPAQVDRGAEPWFTLRCILERPNCVGFALPVVSAASDPFRMASFFDSDAPARAIRIPMPVDISAAGLRKYRKGAGFVLSDLFCGQIERFKNITFVDLVLSVLPWPFHKALKEGESKPCRDGSNAMGLFISLSIPIITICAFILMIIMVTLLNIVFKWLPFLLTVIRIPLSKGAKG